VKTGKVLFGAENSIKSAKRGKIKLIIVAANCPNNTREEIEYYSKLSNIPVIRYKGSNIDLGLVCGKPFSVSALSLRDPGDSEILKIVETADD
jgi:large subunit ribosomal protein L30e